jgi:hypothetical protein
MDPDAVFAMLALVGCGVFALTGMRMLLNYKIKRFETMKGGKSPETDEAIAELREQVHFLRGDVVDLQERLDFTERVLTRGQGNERAVGEP